MLRMFIVGLLLAFIVSPFCVRDFEAYSDVVTFLSIVVGFEITSLSILFGSPLKKVLYDRTNKLHLTELHRLRDYYRFSIIVCVVGVVIIVLVPSFNWEVECQYLSFSIQKSVFVLPIMFSAIWGFSVLLNDLLRIFVYPTNDEEPPQFSAGQSVPNTVSKSKKKKDRNK